jgi:hypothetical protein
MQTCLLLAFWFARSLLDIGYRADDHAGSNANDCDDHRD